MRDQISELFKMMHGMASKSDLEKVELNISEIKDRVCKCESDI